MNKFLKLLPSIVALIGGALSLFDPTIKSWIASDPSAAGVIAAIYGILAHFAPPPHT